MGHLNVRATYCSPPVSTNMNGPVLWRHGAPIQVSDGNHTHRGSTAATGPAVPCHPERRIFIFAALSW